MGEKDSRKYQIIAWIENKQMILYSKEMHKTLNKDFQVDHN